MGLLGCLLAAPKKKGGAEREKRGSSGGRRVSWVSSVLLVTRFCCCIGCCQERPSQRPARLPSNKPCKYWEASGTCRFGAGCRFQHRRRSAGSASSTSANVNVNIDSRSAVPLAPPPAAINYAAAHSALPQQPVYSGRAHDAEIAALKREQLHALQGQKDAMLMSGMQTQLIMQTQMMADQNAQLERVWQEKQLQLQLHMAQMASRSDRLEQEKRNDCVRCRAFPSTNVCSECHVRVCGYCHGECPKCGLAFCQACSRIHCKKHKCIVM